MIGVLQAIQPFIRYANQLVSLLAIVREDRDAMVHVDADAQGKRMQLFRKYRATRRLSASAWSESVCGKSSANSSPPIRKAESEVRSAFLSVVAAARKTSSPRGWPCFRLLL